MLSASTKISNLKNKRHRYPLGYQCLLGGDEGQDALHRPAAYEPKQYRYNSENEEQVYETAKAEIKESEEPSDQQDDCDEIQ
jgi:hypothetical protein